jgi:NAD(P)-dependent dehydrogenase (short-subunit alcohol dehydrogenase family)
MGKLEGKIALITGGNGGIGFATAKRFVKEGAYVFITGRREPETAAAVEEIGRNVTGVQGDVSNLGDLDRLFAQIKREKGRLDIVFANAGVVKLAPLGTITEELYDSVFNINVKGVLFTVQKALPLLPDGASIILNASIGASKGAASEQRQLRHKGRRALVRADIDNGFEGSPHSRERSEPGRHRHARSGRRDGVLGNGPATRADDFRRRSARQVRHAR